jgi:hypothetical protein
MRMRGKKEPTLMLRPGILGGRGRREVGSIRMFGIGY